MSPNRSRMQDRKCGAAQLPTKYVLFLYCVLTLKMIVGVLDTDRPEGK
jgi:hypothetical protein